MTQAGSNELCCGWNRLARVEGVRCGGLRSSNPVSGVFHGNLSPSPAPVSEQSSNVSVSESSAQ